MSENQAVVLARKVNCGREFTMITETALILKRHWFRKIAARFRIVGKAAIILGCRIGTDRPPNTSCRGSIGAGHWSTGEIRPRTGRTFLIGMKTLLCLPRLLRMDAFSFL